MPDECMLDGTMRCYSNEVFKIAKEKVVLIAKTTGEQFGCTVDVDFYEYYPAVINHAKETQDFLEFSKSLLGKECVSSEDLPIPASEDFSYFLEKRPGCFFFLGTGNLEKFLHTSSYDYNDKMVPYGAWLWYQFTQHKF